MKIHWTGRYRSVELDDHESPRGLARFKFFEPITWSRIVNPRELRLTDLSGSLTLARTQKKCLRCCTHMLAHVCTCANMRVLWPRETRGFARSCQLALWSGIVHLYKFLPNQFFKLLNLRSDSVLWKHISRYSKVQKEINPVF